MTSMTQLSNSGAPRQADSSIRRTPDNGFAIFNQWDAPLPVNRESLLQMQVDCIDGVAHLMYLHGTTEQSEIGVSVYVPIAEVEDALRQMPVAA